MKIYLPITVNLYDPYPIKVMNVKQYDTGRGALVTLTGAAGEVIVPETEGLYIYVKKPDGTMIYNTVTLSGTQLKVDFDEQMSVLSGKIQVELQMIGSDGSEVSTPIFTINVMPSNIDYQEITSQNEFGALIDALAEVEELRQNGLKGDPGEAATIQVGSVTASDPGGVPSVINSGTEQAAVFDFVLPRGPQGTPGADGENGEDGSVWYQGTAISGTSTSGTVFSGTGIEYANVNDKYINTGPGDDKGNVYNCVVAGNADTAQWAYAMNILGGGGASTAEEVTYDNGESGLTGSTVQSAIDEIVEDVGVQGTKIDAAIADMADAYSAAATYSAGDYCIQNNTLYKCNTAIDTPEEWTEGHWDATTVAEELGSLNQNMTDGDTLSDGYYIMPNGLHLEWGRVSINASGAATAGFCNYQGQKNVAFKIPFSVTPAVFTSVPSGAAYWNTAASSITTTKFQMLIGGDNTNAQSVAWLAIGI